mgnify:CR=1 FL=1
MRIPDQSIQMQFRSVRRRFRGRYRRAVGPVEVTALLNAHALGDADAVQRHIQAALQDL